MTFLRFTAALVALVAVSACDSGDAIDAPTPGDVAGVYDFDAFRFTPDASALAPVNVLDTLVTGESFVELLDGGQATLRFRRQGGATRFVPGDFEVRRSELRITFDGGNDDTLARLVLPGVLTFERDDDDGLSLSQELTADLEAYDASRYGGFDDVPGTLTLRLERRAADR